MAPGRSGSRTGWMTRSVGSTLKRTPSRRRSRSAAPRRGRGRLRQRLGGQQPRRHGVQDRSPENRVVKTIAVGGSPTAISVGNGRVWVSVRTALVAASGKRGDVVRVASTPIDYVDPAIADSLDSWQIEYATCVGIAQLPGSAGAGRISARPGSSGGNANTLRRRQELHVHGQARLPFLAAVERPRHRPNLQVRDRTGAEP